MLPRLYSTLELLFIAEVHVHSCIIQVYHKSSNASVFIAFHCFVFCLYLCRGVPRNLKRWVGEGLHVFRRPIYPLKSSKDQKKVIAFSDVLLPLFRGVEIYISLYFSEGGGGPSGPPGYDPVMHICSSISIIMNSQTI